MANESQTEVEPFVSKQWSYIIDSNSGVYLSSQVTIDTSSWSNSGKFVDWAECYLTIPMVMVAYPTAAIAGWDAWDASWLVGIKNGHHQLIDSMSVDIQNSSVLQLTRFTNIYANYRMLTSMAATELKNIAPSIGFFPDTSDSFGYSAAASPSGQGSTNNLVWGFEKLYPSTLGRIYNNQSVAAGAWSINAQDEGFVTDTVYTANQPLSPSIKTLANVGLYERMKTLVYNPALAPYSTLLTQASCETLLKNFYYSVPNGAVPDTGYKVWSYIAKIRLKDISSVFEQMGLLRGIYARFILNVNTGSAQFNTVAPPAAPAPPSVGTFTPAEATITQANTQCTYGTLPFMVTSFHAGQPATTLDTFLTANTSFIVRNGIGSVEFTDATGAARKVSAMANQVRLYGPLIVLSPTAEQQYLSLNPTRKIVYRDIYEYNANDIDSDFNVLLSNGLVNTKTLIVVPFYTKTENGTAFNVSPLQSAFCSEPATTSPLAAITNYNVALAGVNVYQNNYRYNWESFLTELNMINSINGNTVTGLSSGLLTERDFDNTYRFYVTDLSRRIAAEDSVPKSLQILGQNLCGRKVDLYCFVEVEKSMVINTSSGERIE